jgi:hypothetical protein
VAPDLTATKKDQNAAGVLLLQACTRIILSFDLNDFVQSLHIEGVCIWSMTIYDSTCRRWDHLTTELVSGFIIHLSSCTHLANAEEGTTNSAVGI